MQVAQRREEREKGGEGEERRGRRGERKKGGEGEGRRRGEREKACGRLNNVNLQSMVEYVVYLPLSIP